MNNDIDNAIKKAISNIERIHGIVSTDIQRSLELAIKALEEQLTVEQPTGEWEDYSVTFYKGEEE